MTEEVNIREGTKSLSKREGATKIPDNLSETVRLKDWSEYVITERDYGLFLSIDLYSNQLEGKGDQGKYVITDIALGINTDSNGNWVGLGPNEGTINGPIGDRELRQQCQNQEGIIVTVFRDKRHKYKLLYTPEAENPNIVRLDRVFGERGGYIEDVDQEQLTDKINDMPRRFDVLAAIDNILTNEHSLEDLRNATPLRKAEISN